MPLPIQALPRGLVGLLELNTGGAGPPVLADQVGAVLDISEFYWLNKREKLFQTGVAAGTAAGTWNFATSMTVPNNEAWLVYQYSIQVAPPIGLTAQICAALQANFGGVLTSLMIGEPTQNASSALASNLICRSQSPFIATPGSVLSGVTLALSAATAFNASGAADIVRFRI